MGTVVPRVRRSFVVSAVVALLVSGISWVGAGVPALAEQNESSAFRIAASSIAAASDHTCALLDGGTVRCWGYGSPGQLGYDNTTSVGDGVGSDPSIGAAGDVPLGGSAVAITAGTSHTCALLLTGAVRCWGFNGAGQLGYGNTTTVGNGYGPSIEVAGDVPLGGTAVAISAGAYHTCALLSAGAVRCWGQNNAAQLGYGNTQTVGDGAPGDKSIVDAGDVPLGGTAVAIAAGYHHTCALLATGAVRCWGDNTYGQLGYNTTTSVGDGSGPSIQSAGDVPLGGTAVAITAGGQHTCALLSNGAVRCWGLNDAGQLGYNTTTDVGDGPGPTIESAGDVPLGGTALAITAGVSHTCALLSTGGVRCWGDGTSGQLGYGKAANVGDGVGFDKSIETAGDVPLGGTAVAITAGDNDTCALLGSGAVRCWGAGTAGQLGYNDTSNVGDGYGPSIEVAGDVPVGAAVRTQASPRLTATFKPTRDRTSPYTFTLHGALTATVTSPFQPDPAVCGGTIAILVKAGTKKILAKTASVADACTYRTALKVPFKKLPAAMRHRILTTTKPGILTVRIRFTGTGNLNATLTKRQIKVG